MKGWFKAAVGLCLSTAAAHGQIFTWTDAGDKVGNSDFASMVWVQSHSPADMVAAANKLKARPAGKRCLFLWADVHGIFRDPSDQLPGKMTPLWWPNGVAKSIAAQKSLIAQLTTAGVKPDYIVLDNEGLPSRWTMTAANVLAVSKDPRGAALGVPAVLPDEASGLAFDFIADRAGRSAVRQGIFAPLLAYAPSAVAVQWNDYLMTAEEGQIVRDINGHALFSDTLAGNTQNTALYGSRGLNPQTHSAYGVAIYSENLLRVLTRHGNVMPWYSGDLIENNVWRGTNYWGECARHGLLTCGLRGLLFDPEQPTAAPRFSAIYNETKQAAGGTLPTTMCSSDLIDPAAPFYVTARADRWDGITPANRVVGRVTFAPGVNSATFNVAGRSFTTQPAAGQSGAWFSYSAATTGPASKTAAPAKVTTITKPSARTPVRWFDPTRLGDRRITPR